MTNEQLTELAAQARRAHKIATEHPEEATGLLSRLADVLTCCAEWKLENTAIDYLSSRLDSLELALGGGING